MNAHLFCTAGWRFHRLAPLLALVLVVGIAYAAERSLIPEEFRLPLYATGLGHTDTGWVATAFYRPLECVPKNVDLYLFDFNIDPACPLFVEGFAIQEEGAVVPTHVVLQNVPGAPMPICFAESTEFLKAMANGKVTVRELTGMKSLLIGWADFYHEILQPLDPLDPLGKAVSNVVASGFLEDGRSFYLHSEVIFRHGDVKDAQYNVTVRFGD